MQNMHRACPFALSPETNRDNSTHVEAIEGDGISIQIFVSQESCAHVSNFTQYTGTLLFAERYPTKTFLVLLRKRTYSVFLRVLRTEKEEINESSAASELFSEFAVNFASMKHPPTRASGTKMTTSRFRLSPIEPSGPTTTPSTSKFIGVQSACTSNSLSQMYADCKRWIYATHSTIATRRSVTKRMSSF